MNINEIERLKKLSGITAVTEAAATKYANHDKASLNKVKSELQGVMALANRASFKYKNAAEELKLVNDCLKQLEEPEKKDVKEGTDVVEPVVEAKKDDDDKEEKDEKDSKEDKKDSDEKKDEDKDSKEDDKTDKDEKKDSEKEDDKPAFLKDKKDDEDEDKSEKKEDKDSDDDEEDEEEESDESDDDEEDDKKVCESVTPEHMTDSEKEEREKIVHGMKKNKAELKKKYGSKWKQVMYATATKTAMESVETAQQIAARIMETDLTPTKVEVDYENGPTENSGIKYERGTKIRLPNAVKNVVKDRIKQLDDAILRYDDKGYDDKSIKQQAVDCLNQILQDLSTGDLEGLKKAQIYFGTLMSPLTDFFPPQLINWLANANNQYVADVE